MVAAALAGVADGSGVAGPALGDGEATCDHGSPSQAGVRTSLRSQSALD